MKTFLRSTISTFFYLLNLRQKRAGIIVLMYHRINDDLPANDLVTPTAVFKRQMKYLKDHHEVISLEKFTQTMTTHSSGNKLTGTKIVITFDDGYRDNYLNAFKILKEYGFPATIFLTTGMIGTNQRRTRYQQMPVPDMLSWEEVREMYKSCLISFAAHTETHPRLGKLTPQQQKIELNNSIQTLIQKLALSKDSFEKTVFCYPYGDYTQDTLKVADELGIKYAFTVKPGINTLTVHPLELRRTEINGKDTLFDFQKKLAGAYDWLHTQIQKRKTMSFSIL